MTTRSKLVTTYDPQQVIQPLYTGGDVALSARGDLLVTCLTEEVVLSNLSNGRILARIDGVRSGCLLAWTSAESLIGW